MIETAATAWAPGDEVAPALLATIALLNRAGRLLRSTPLHAPSRLELVLVDHLRSLARCTLSAKPCPFAISTPIAARAAAVTARAAS